MQHMALDLCHLKSQYYIKNHFKTHNNKDIDWIQQQFFHNSSSMKNVK